MTGGRMSARRRSGVWALTAAGLVVLTALSGCATGGRGEPAAGAYEGPPERVGEGTARTFVVLDAAGKATAIGVKLSEAALAGLPASPPAGQDGWEHVLVLPKEAKRAGYTHVGLDWNPKGHQPPGVYDVPHFDFHFYMIDPAERAKITAVGEDLARAHRQPPAEFMPAGYVLPPGTEVPRMGAHAINPAAGEFNKKPFTKTFLYGFYDGRMIFVEPMVSKAFLETRPDVAEAITLPKRYPANGHLPTRYTVKYDAGRKEYTVALEGLTAQ